MSRTTGAPSPPPAPPLAPGTRPAPGYTVLAHLARTGWLDLYDAWSEERCCRCVLKLVRPDRRRETRLRDRLLQEGRWLQGFTHPHLVRAYATIERPEPLVVLETLSGETLDHLIARLRHRPAVGDLAVLGLQLCSAVRYLHGRGLLHLDIKPANVVVDCGRAKLIDLSVARAPGPAPAGVGTWCYLSPEQARGETLTAAADVWGIGVTLYEAATGEMAFPVGEGGTGETDSGTAALREGRLPERGTAVSGAPLMSAPEDGGDTDKEGRGGQDDWYPQLDGRAPPVGTRRRLPQGPASAIDACLEPDPAGRPTVAGLAAALDASLPRHRRCLPRFSTGEPAVADGSAPRASGAFG